MALCFSEVVIRSTTLGLKGVLYQPAFHSYMHPLQNKSHSWYVFELTLNHIQTQQQPTLDTSCLVMSLYLLEILCGLQHSGQAGTRPLCSPARGLCLVPTEGINCDGTACEKLSTACFTSVSFSICALGAGEESACPSENRAVETH